MFRLCEFRLGEMKQSPYSVHEVCFAPGACSELVEGVARKDGLNENVSRRQNYPQVVEANMLIIQKIVKAKGETKNSLLFLAKWVNYLNHKKANQERTLSRRACPEQRRRDAKITQRKFIKTLRSLATLRLHSGHAWRLCVKYFLKKITVDVNRIWMPKTDPILQPNF